MSIERAEDPEFFSSYISMLRTNSQIDNLVHHKREISKHDLHSYVDVEISSRNNLASKLKSQLHTYQPGETARPSQLFNNTLTDEQRRAIGMSRANRNSYRLN